MEQSKIAKAEAYLRQQLSSGPKLSADLKASGEFNKRTLERAAKRLRIIRSRVGHNGAWRWSLPESYTGNLPVAGEYMPPAAGKTAKAKALKRLDRQEEVAIWLFRQQIRPPVAVPVAPTIDELLAIAEEAGLKYPLRVSSAASLQWCVRNYRERGAAPEYEINEFTPDENCPYVAVRELRGSAAYYRSLAFDASERAGAGHAGMLGWYATAL